MISASTNLYDNFNAEGKSKTWEEKSYTKKPKETSSRDAKTNQDDKKEGGFIPF